MKPATRPRRTAICREGWYWILALAVVAGGAVLREGNLLFLLAGMFLGPLVISRRLAAATLRGLQLRRKIPRGICAGDMLVVCVDLSNPRKRIGSWAVVVEEEVRREDDPRACPLIRPAMFYPYVPAGQSRTQAYQGRLPQRGRYRLGPLRISTRFPFGLFRRTVTVDQSGTLTVLPRLGRLRPGWIVRRREAVYGTQLARRRPGRTWGDFYGVREWRAGDSLRWIHWRSSARHGELIAQQFEQRRNRQIAVLVDLWQPAKPTAEDRQHVELAVSFAATVVASVCRQGGHKILVGIAAAKPECAGGPTSTALLEHVMERLAIARASCDDHLPALLQSALGHVEPDSEILLVTTRAVDVSDRGRFAPLCGAPAVRAAAERICLINTATRELGNYFQLE